jgi:hypothetical protein
MRIALLAAALALALPATATANDDAAYWAFADTVQRELDRVWDEQAGRYRSGLHSTDTVFNANVLLTHSAAARAGHAGAARQDVRARRIAEALIAAPAFIEGIPRGAPPDPQRHVPGWTDSMSDSVSNQHAIVDAEAVDGLLGAWRARHELGLPDRTADAIANRIRRVARSRFFRWPSLRLNQINWPAQLYAAHATTTGDATLLRRDLRRQIERFARRPGNLGGGLQFHYLPHKPARHRFNLDSPEYACIVASFTRFYEQAIRAGMARPSARARRLLRRWLMRVLAGYWTHGGYLNWDTGLGFVRWHQTKKFALGQLSLIGIASAPSLAPAPGADRWAKWLFDRALGFYARHASRAGGIAPALMFGVDEVPQGISDARLAAARVQANAARAVEAGLGRMAASAPPPLAAFDPDTGRLAVTTPRYSTAVIPSTRGALPYGGLELARLFDGDHEVAANIGGRPPAAFGLIVRASDRRQLATQVPFAPAHSRRRAFAGPFRRLRLHGTTARRGLAVRTTHTFAPRWIETRWRVRGRAESVAALFPSTGDGAAVVAVLRDGTRVAVTRRPIGLARVVRFHIRSDHGGYAVIPRTHPAGATARIVGARAQPSAPDPGPTLVIGLRRASRFTARVVPAAPARP